MPSAHHRPMHARRVSRKQSLRRSLGMTLIEIMIVLAAFALMAGMVVMGFGTSRAAEMTRAVNQLANTVRYGYDKSRVTGDYFRLLIDFEKRSFTLQRGDDRMYLPATDRDGKIREVDERKLEERDERDRRAAESYNRSAQSQLMAANRGNTEEGGLNPYLAVPKEVPRRKPPLFEAFETENELGDLKAPIVLPDDVKIVSVRTADDLKPITEGQASIYFFPRGQTQKAHILLEDEGAANQFTIKVEPLTGRVHIEEGHEELVLPSDPRNEEDELGNRRTRRTF